MQGVLMSNHGLPDPTSSRLGFYWLNLTSSILPGVPHLIFFWRCQTNKPKLPEICLDPIELKFIIDCK